MKRIIALFCAALLIACMAPALAQTLTRSTGVGSWELESFTMGGMKFSPEMLGPVIINIHEDDTVAFCMDGRFCVSPVTWTAEGAAFNAPMTPVLLTLGTDGALCATIDLDGTALVLHMKRAAAGDPDAAITALTGRWKEVHTTYSGMDTPRTLQLGVSMTVYDDGYALLSMPDGDIGGLFVTEDGALLLTDDAGSRYPVTLDQQGQLLISFPGSALLMTLAREPEAAADLSALSGLFTAPAAGGLDGVWVCVGGSVNGEFFTLEDRPIDVTLTVTGGLDTLNYGGTVIQRDAITTSDSVTIAGIRFELNGSGQLTYTTERDGIVLTIYLERQGE